MNTLCQTQRGIQAAFLLSLALVLTVHGNLAQVGPCTRRRCPASLKLLANSSLSSLCLGLPFSKAQVVPQTQLSSRCSTEANQNSSSTVNVGHILICLHCLQLLSCSCHLSLSDLFVPSCCHILIYVFAADGKALARCSATGVLYAMVKVINSSRDQEVNSKLLSSAWTEHKSSLKTIVQAAATQYRN